LRNDCTAECINLAETREIMSLTHFLLQSLPPLQSSPENQLDAAPTLRIFIFNSLDPSPQGRSRVCSVIGSYARLDVKSA